jgi:uncharacterized protein YrrD
MQTAHELTGKQVISIDHGEAQGKVRDLYFDPQLQYLVALSLGGGGIFGARPKIIRLENVAVLGNDAVLIKSSNDVQDPTQVEETATWIRLSDFRGSDVRTSGGTPIGKVDDVTLGEDGRVLDILLAWTRVGGPIGASNMVTRRAIVDVGTENHIITIDLAAAEQE